MRLWPKPVFPLYVGKGYNLYTMRKLFQFYLIKAEEGLFRVESEFTHDRYNNVANR